MIFNSSGVSQLVLGLMAKVISPFASKEPKAHNNRNMVTASQEEIDLHNSKVSTRQVKRSTQRLNAKLGK
jgi:hypothetical protein